VAATAVDEVLRNSRRVGIPYYTAMSLRRLAVLSGSNPAARAEYLEAGSSVGRLLAENGITLLYDGVSQGSIGALVVALNTAEGRALSVPLEELAERSDGFLALPGGPATLDELFATCLPSRPGPEKPCGLLNTADYFTGLLETVDDAILERFVRETQRGRLVIARDPAELLRALADFRPPETRRQLA
jgi:predicted Rossmann-fold nucleotide-binding protein